MLRSDQTGLVKTPAAVEGGLLGTVFAGVTSSSSFSLFASSRDPTFIIPLRECCILYSSLVSLLCDALHAPFPHPTGSELEFILVELLFASRPSLPSL